MPPGIGYSRDIPLQGDSGGPNSPQGGANAGGMSPQEAVQILSLRVPERPSPTALAPLPLLTSPGGMGAGAQGLDSMIAALIQAFGGGGSGLGRGPNPQMPTFGGPDTPSQRPGGGGSRVEIPPFAQKPPMNIPPPHFRPGAPPGQGEIGGEIGGGGAQPLPLPQPPAMPQGLPNKRFPQQFPGEGYRDLFGNDMQNPF